SSATNPHRTRQRRIQPLHPQPSFWRSQNLRVCLLLAASVSYLRPTSPRLYAWASPGPGESGASAPGVVLVSAISNCRNRIPIVRTLLLTLALAVLAPSVLIAPPLHAQQQRSALSEKEIDEVRDARLVPSDCIVLFVKFLDARTKAIQDLYAKPRRPGREQDTHDLLVQFTSIADEL